jgi:glycosyltransferase involved in cell wall biosynthesis
MDKKISQTISLVIEGTYPYVSGGVATWIHQIISKLPEFNFYLIVLLAKKEDAETMKYNLPENIKGIYHVFLQEYPKRPIFFPKKLKGKELLENWLNDFSYESFKEIAKFYYFLNNKQRIVLEGLYSKDSFDLEKYIYRIIKTEASFINFFWNLRSLIINVLNVFAANPQLCRVVHTISTGFAGLLASILKIANPEITMLLTEHGIYTRERDIEISVGVWPDTDPNKYRPQEGLGSFKEMWRESFFYFSKICYLTADQIITLHEKNRRIEIEQGAPPEKTVVIRNGINLSKYRFRHRTKMSDPPVIGFLGRIVKIKDVKTLIRAAKIVIQKRPGTIFKIAGPYDEDSEYYEECRQLVKMLLMEKNVKFLGKVDAVKFFEEIDLLILTSISEGQPLVIAEAASCGVPTVATDVGGCKEMLYGGGDDKLGKSGLIAEQANTIDIAHAILKFISDEEFYSKCSLIGRERVEKFYNEEHLLNSYKKIYSRYLTC